MSVNIKVTGGLNIESGQIDPKAAGGLNIESGQIDPKATGGLSYFRFILITVSVIFLWLVLHSSEVNSPTFMTFNNGFHGLTSHIDIYIYGLFLLMLFSLFLVLILQV